MRELLCAALCARTVGTFLLFLAHPDSPYGLVLLGEVVETVLVIWLGGSGKE